MVIKLNMYIHPGYTHKKPMYEIKPGVWVPRHQVPENRGRSWESNNKRNNSERGFIMNLYSSTHREARQGRHGKGIPTIFEFTKKTWWEHWKKQNKRIWNEMSLDSKVIMNLRFEPKKDAVLRKTEKSIPTNISKDQLWPGRGYTPINLVFCTVKFNTQEKKCITPDGCEAVSDLYNERMDRWAQEMLLQREMNKIDISTPENIKHYRKELRKI